MNSILTNSAALSALQSLDMTQKNLQITQNQVSTGLAVQNASDNAAYWAIGQQLTSDNSIVTAANTALAQSQSILDTSNSALSSVITTIDAIQAAITEAQNPGASFTDINTTLSSLSNQLSDAITGASFNGVNLLNGTQSAMSFVSGYASAAQGGSVSDVALTATALTGGSNVANTGATSAATTVTDPNLINQLEATTGATVANPAAWGTGGTTTITGGGTSTITVVSTNGFGDALTTTYNAFTSTGAAAASNQSATQSGAVTGAAYWTETTQLTTVAGSPSGALVQFGTTLNAEQYNLTQLGSGTGQTAVTSANAADMLSAVNASLSAVKTYASQIGAAQDAMTTAATFNSALQTDFANGIAALVDADMNTASTRLQALQTQQQLGIQSLSIANQNAQLIMKLFS